MTDAITPAYTGSRAWEAVGAWIAYVTCLRCGAAVILDESDNESAIAIHDRFHDLLDRLEADSHVE